MKKWKVVVGSDIGPNTPANYTLTQGLPWLPNAIELAVVGIVGKYCDWLIGTSMSLPVGAQNIEDTVTFNLATDYLGAAQAIELDRVITDVNGITYNGSSQFDCSASATEMTWDICNAGGHWVGTGITLPKFTPGVDHVVSTQMSIDPVKKSFAMLQITIDGTTYPVPAAMQNVSGESRGWGKGEIVPQAQQDVNAKGGSWEWCIKDWHFDCW
jgi:hypothetical protein